MLRFVDEVATAWFRVALEAKDVFIGGSTAYGSYTRNVTAEKLLGSVVSSEVEERIPRLAVLHIQAGDREEKIITDAPFKLLCLFIIN